MTQDRTLLLTNQYLYNIKDQALVQRKIGVEDIKAITKKSMPGHRSFLIHVFKQYDYHYASNSREDILNAIKWVYYSVNKKNIPVYGVPDKLDKYETTKKHLSSGKEIPQDENNRLRDEDLYPEDNKPPSDSLRNTVPAEASKSL